MSEAPKHTEECKDATAPPGHDAPGDAENAGDQRPKLTRASTSYYFRAKSQWVDRVSGLVATRRVQRRRAAMPRRRRGPTVAKLGARQTRIDSRPARPLASQTGCASE